MHLRRLTRTPALYWAAVAALAFVTGFTVTQLTSAARAERARYGRVAAVAVALRPVETGAILSAADIEVRRMPVALVPEGPSAPDEVVGRRVLAPLFKGEPVLRAHLAPSGSQGLAALVPPAARAVAVPAGAGRVPVQRGDSVDVLATLETGGANPTFAVATGASVLDVGAEAVTLTVNPDEALRVAFAVTRGR